MVLMAANRTASWLEWASKKEDEARAYDKAGDRTAANITRETMRAGLRRADEVFAEEAKRGRS
jgi:hypothetical protein